MSDEREESPRSGGSGDGGGGKQLASSALLVGAVAVILAAGFVLKAERPAAGATSAPPPPEVVLGRTVSPELAPPPTAQTPAPPADEIRDAPAPAPPLPTAPPASSTPVATDPVFERLATRAAGDAPRLAAARRPWTAQLLVACRAETVDRVITASKGATKLYVLPAEVKGDACFRICWGTYATAKEASAAADLPNALRGKEKIGAVEVAKVTR